MKTARMSKLYTAALALALAAVLVSASIAAPILCRPFYYAHIDGLKLTQTTPWSREEIVQAYDEMLDFCLDKGEFSTGVLAWSDWGKSHFEDVKVLFLLDLDALRVSLAVLVALLVVGVFGRIRPRPMLGHGPGFWAGTGLAVVFLLVGGLAALDFDRAFVIFHTLFFPGKENWILDWRVDEIINILPEEFFRNCAILILALLVLGCAVLIVGDIVWQKRCRQKEGRA